MASAAPAARPAKRLRADRLSSRLEIEGDSVELTHLDRVYWPAAPELGQAAITKRDLIRYWVRMSPLALPHLRDRPLTLFRWPGGIEGRRILLKHPEASLPPFVETATIWSETKAADDVYLLCNNLATLVWLAGNGVLEIHVWHSRVRTDERGTSRPKGSGSAASLSRAAVNHPDYVLFDLDPYLYSGRERSGGEPEPSAEGFEQGRRVAFWLKAVLDGMALRSYVKTTGKTGLHVILPIAPTLRYDMVRRIARTICEHLLGEHPDVVTTAWSTAERTGKVFLDFNMNVRGKSMIAPWGPRGLPGAPVSMPLAWRELPEAQPAQYRLPILAAGRRRRDPWSEALENRQSLEATLARLK